MEVIGIIKKEFNQSQQTTSHKTASHKTRFRRVMKRSVDSWNSRQPQWNKESGSTKVGGYDSNRSL